MLFMFKKMYNLAFRMNIFKHYILSIIFLLPFTSCVNAQGSVDGLNKKLFESFEKKEFDKSENIALSILGDTTLKDTSIYNINANTILAILYKDKGYYRSAIDKNLLVVKSAEKRKDYERLSAAYNNIGVIYNLQRDYSSAIKYFSKSLNIESKYNKPLSKSIRFYNLGESYKELDSFDLALSYFSNSLIIEKKHNNTEGVLYASLGLIDVYLNIGQVSDAKRLLKKVEGDVSIKSDEIYILFQKLRGYSFFKEKKYGKAITAFNDLESYLSGKNNKSFLIDLFELQIEVYEEMNDWRNLSLKYKSYLDLISNDQTLEIQNKLNDVMHQNDMHKKNLELRLIEKDRDYNASLNNYSSKVAVFLLLLLVFIVGFIFYGINKK